MSYRSKAVGADEIRTFLRAVDRHLTRAVSIEVIGGSAASLAHGATSTTTDIDTLSATSPALEDAVARAREETGLEIPLQHSIIAEVPYHFEDRLERQLPELTRLAVWVLEKHDLALSKAVRCQQHDLDQLREIKASVGLTFDTLVARYRDEMSQVLGDPMLIRSNFLDMIEALFGEVKMIEARRILAAAGR